MATLRLLSTIVIQLSILISLVTSQIREAEPTESPLYTLTEEFCFKYGYCYSIWKFKYPHSQVDALNYCKNQGQTLATIPTTEVQKKLAFQLSGENDESWTGLHLSAASSWKWLHKDGWLENITPSNNSAADRSVCTIVSRGRMLNNACSHNLSYICEFDDKPDPSGCDIALQKIGIKWVCATRANSTWAAAAGKCDANNGNLLIIENDFTLNLTKTMLVRVNEYFWTAGTRVMFSWDEENAPFINAYGLIWSPFVANNPNLEEVVRNGRPMCVALSNSRQGFKFKRCTDKVSQAICSKVNPNPESGLEDGERGVAITAIPPIVTTAGTTDKHVISSDINTTAITTISTATLSISSLTTTASSIIIARAKTTTNQSSKYITTSTATGRSVSMEFPENMGNVTSSHVRTSQIYSGITEKQYKAVLICAYILAALVLIGIVLLILMIVRRRMRKRKPRFYDPVLDKKSYRTLGNGTLGKQRRTDPTEEWDKVVTENEVLPTVQMRDKSDTDNMDIIHNVPLDPRASLEQPLTIPRESQVLTLQRAKSRESQSSLASSEVATFTLDRRSNGTNSSASIMVAPPVPPKTKPILKPESAKRYSDFPPPPAELNGLDDPPAPLVLPKPGKRVPKQRHRRKAPDPIYAEIDKTSRRSTAPTLAKPRSSHSAPKYGTLPHQLNVDTSVPPDNCDSGVEMGVYSPLHSSARGLAATDSASSETTDHLPALAYLDDILNHLTNS